MLVDLKLIFLASLMFVELTQKISEWRLIEKKVYDNFKNLKNCNLKKKMPLQVFHHFFLPFSFISNKRHGLVKVCFQYMEGSLEQWL